MQHFSAVDLAFIENGDIAKVKTHSVNDNIPKKGSQSIGYTTFTFEDGSAIVVRFQRLIAGDGSATVKSIVIKGTGRFEGIKETSSEGGKNFSQTQSEPARASTDFTMPYTLSK